MKPNASDNRGIKPVSRHHALYLDRKSGFRTCHLCLHAQFYSTKTRETINYIAGKYPDLVPLYDEIYNKHKRSYFEALEVKAEKMAKKYDCAFVDNEMPYGRVPQGHPVIVDYFYHEEIRGTENTGKRNR